MWFHLVLCACVVRADRTRSRTRRIPAAAPATCSSGGRPQTSSLHTSRSQGPDVAEVEHRGDEAVDVELAVARRHPVPQAVVLVVVERRCGRAVAHLHPHEQFGRDPSDQVEIVGATGVMPDVGAHATVGSVGRFDDGDGVGCIDDVRERQELQADRGAVLGRTIAQLAEASAGIGGRPVDRPDRLDVRHVELVDQRPHQLLEVEVPVGRGRGAPPRQRLDLGHDDVVSVEEFVDARSTLHPSPRTGYCPAKKPIPSKPAAPAARIRSSSGWSRARLKWESTSWSEPGVLIGRRSPASSAATWRDSVHSTGSNSDCSAMPFDHGDQAFRLVLGFDDRGDRSRRVR